MRISRQLATATVVVRKRQHSPCAFSLRCASIPLGPAPSGGVVVLPWARGQSRGRIVFASRWCWGWVAGVGAQKCRSFFLSARLQHPELGI